MEHDARNVANEIIKRAFEAGIPITHLQVMKLVYYCHAWMLAIHNRPLLSQPVEAWKYGPVIPDVWRSLRRYGAEPITRLIAIEQEEFEPEETDIIDQVWAIYGSGKFSGGQLSNMTHKKGTPWHTIINRHGEFAVIPDPIIERHYKAELERAMANGRA